MKIFCMKWSFITNCIPPPLSKISFIIYVPDIIFSLDILVVTEVSESAIESKWNGSKVYPLLLLPTKRRPEEVRRGNKK